MRNQLYTLLYNCALQTHHHTATHLLHALLGPLEDDLVVYLQQQLPAQAPEHGRLPQLDHRHHHDVRSAALCQCKHTQVQLVKDYSHERE